MTSIISKVLSGSSNHGRIDQSRSRLSTPGIDVESVSSRLLLSSHNLWARVLREGLQLRAIFDQSITHALIHSFIHLAADDLVGYSRGMTWDS